MRIGAGIAAEVETARRRPSPRQCNDSGIAAHVPMPGAPKGLALDSRTSTLAVAVREPDAIVLVDPNTGVERARVPLGSAAHHLQLAAPGGPVLVPADPRSGRPVRVGRLRIWSTAALGQQHVT